MREPEPRGTAGFGDGGSAALGEHHDEISVAEVTECV
jgi:hypothetical protein